MEVREYLAEADKLDEDTVGQVARGKLSTAIEVFKTLDEKTDSDSFTEMIGEAGIDDKGAGTWKFLEALAEKDTGMAGRIAHEGVGYWLGVLKTELLRQELLDKANE
ncbi:MAG: hypothetical protein ACFB50_18360 [Rubrobacteraceae bacterium]